MAKRPNVLWIQTDEHRADSLGCLGSGWAKSPHLDGLAERGVVFSRAYCQSPVCVPSRTSQLCCRYPQEVNTLVNQACNHDGVLPVGTRMFTEAFGDAGYLTFNIGKRHIASCHGPSFARHESLFTFDKYAGCWSLGEGYRDEDYRVIHRRRNAKDIIIGGTYPGSETDNPSRFITDRAIEFLKDEASALDGPFFLRVSHNWPHTPVLPPRPWDELFEAGDLPIRYPDSEAIAGRSLSSREAAAFHAMAELTRAEIDQVWTDYFGLCAYVDHEIGRLLGVVEGLGLGEETIIVFSADHGRMLGEFGTGEKGVFDDASWRVPLIFSWPGHLPAGARRDDLCELLDFGPTLLSLAGLGERREEGWRGRDLFDAGESEPEAVFGQINMPNADAPMYRRVVGERRGLEPMHVGVCTQRYRLDVDYMAGGERLDLSDGNMFDLEVDPGEVSNVYQDAGYAHVRADLIGRIDGWFEGLDKPGALFSGG